LKLKKKITISSSINQIKVIPFLNEKHLFVVGDDGLVEIYNSDLILIFKFKNETESTWSLSCSSNQEFICFGDNSHGIKIFNFIHNSLSTLVGHSHNVPCVDVSKCGKFIVSSSIDGSVRIWNQHKELKRNKLNDQWGWSCKFIEKESLQQKCEFTLENMEEKYPPIKF
jgi:WD40 repeat protein